jgi:thiosulfate/3-mercaptopyruvate sulfurtransferase
VRSRWSHTIDRDTLAGRLGTVTLIDARAPERYRGDVEPVDPVAGHIPTARSLPTGGNLDDDGRFRDPDALRGRYAPLGEGVVTSCGSGITACHDALAMRIAGLPDPLLYAGSYSDWSRSGMPVATGDEPGEVPTTPEVT